MADRVRLTSEGEEIEGVLIQSDDPKFVVVKLDNGYNIGIRKNSVKNLKKIGTVKTVKSRTVKPKTSSKKKITILHTGGTIASKVDYKTGAVTAKFDPSELLSMFPELQQIAAVDSRLIRNIQSENMRFDHYNLLAKEVEKEVKKGAKGVIITHGTDTMHYSSAALSFALENINIPVVFVGSQRSSDRPSADAYMNLICASVFIVNTDFKGVGICMHEGTSDDTCIIIHGTRARKMHTSRRDAFRPVNSTAIARVDFEKKSIKYLSQYNKESGTLKLRLFNPKLKIGLVKMHTHMYASEFEPYMKFDGLVLELFALGQGPIMAQDAFMKENEKISSMIKKLAKKMPVAAASQCIYGRLDMTVYSEGRELMKLGVLGNGSDMTPETAFIKLAWLISNKMDPNLFTENLRGEIAKRNVKGSFLA